MRIGLDARMIAHEGEVTGVGRLVIRLAQSLEQRGHRCTLFYDRKPSFKPTPRAEIIVIPLKNRFLWEQVGLPIALWRHRVDLYHTAWNYGLPLLASGRFVVTTHDLIPLKLPGFFQGLRGKLDRLVYLISLLITLLRAKWIFTDSGHSRQDIEKSFPWVEGKLSVVPYGRELYFKPQGAVRIREVLAKYSLPGRYIIYTGGLDRRKNIHGLIEAFGMLVREERSIHLVVVGERNRLFLSLKEQTEAQGLGSKVHFPGYVADNDLPALISGAQLLAYPSFYEGFGVPVLEALACGTPVLTSNRTSIPEICGDACLLVNPDDIRTLAEGIRKLLRDQKLRYRLRQLGLKQATKFSWEQSIRKIMEKYEEIVS